MTKYNVSLLFSHSFVSDSFRPHGLQHARPPCPSPSPGVCSNSCPLSQWCHPTISSSVSPFSSCFQSFLASGSFPMGQLFASGGQSIGASASVSVLPMNIQGWFLLGLIGLISLLSKELSRVFSSTTLWKHSDQPSVPSLPYGPVLTSVHDYRWLELAQPNLCVSLHVVHSVPDLKPIFNTLTCMLCITVKCL